uniref:Integrase catalytic domain-containing protein n=1 Tax=Fagus sylvatica TaxID=28930 RepID=A0A2N9HA42_FAGSY
MSMRMKDSESLKSYSLRYWEVYNEVDGGTKDMAIKTFKQGLDPESELRHSLSKRPAKSVRDLMSRIQQYEQVEEDRARIRITSAQSRPPRRPANMEPKRVELPVKSYPVSTTKGIGQRGDPSKRDPNKYCSYHRDKGHMIERCYSLKQHLEELAKARHLRHYTGEGQRQHYHEGPTVAHNTRPAARVIEMIHTFHLNGQSYNRLSEQLIFFSDEDLRDVQTPHDDPLVIKLRIGDSDVKRVLIDQGSCSKMYPNLFQGLGLKQSDLQPYDAPLVGFSGESVQPMGRIMMTVHTGPISLNIEFLVLDAPSPYTAIMGRRWLHRLKAVPSSLHQKLCFPMDFGIMEIKGRSGGFQTMHYGHHQTESPRGKAERGKIVAECSKVLGEPLFLYLAVSERAVSAVLILIKDTVQCPVYYTSKTMMEAETRYLPLEKVGLALITVAKNLPQYFQAHTIYVGSGTGVVIITPDETVIEQSIRLDFKTSNNETEYEAVLAGLNLAKTLGAKQLIVHCDSLLVASQINGEYMARDERMAAYLHVDSLATFASVLSANFKRVIPIESLATPSIAMPACPIHTITVSPCWMDPYVHYLKEGVLSEQKREAEIIRRKAVRFWLSKDLKLYKRSFSGPYLLCVHPDIVEDLLYEIHEGICGSHTGRRSLAHRALTQGYWWPYMQKDAVEAEPLANIRDKDSIKFIWKNIITKFGIPKTIISDNGTQFTNKPFMKYCLELGIRNVYSSPAYPQSNGQAEASNKTVLDGIKKRLEDAKGRWVEELPNVLWTFRTTPRRSTGETPFSLAYGSEAVIPLEIDLPTLRTSEWEPTRNNLAQFQALDLLEERREQATIRLASYQQQLKKGYNKNVRPEILPTR